MTVRKKICAKCGTNAFITSFPFKEGSCFERQDVCRACIKAEATRVCEICGVEKLLDEFSIIPYSKKRRPICKDCYMPLRKQMNKVIENKTVICRYTYEHCVFSYKYALCCHECPLMPYCYDRCDTKPLREPNGCGCYAK